MRVLRLALTLAIASAGCAPDTGLEIVIREVGVVPGTTINRIFVELVASQNMPESRPGEPDVLAYTCQSESWGGPEGELRLPVTIVVRPGEIDWACVGVRVSGYFNNDLRVRAEGRYCHDLTDGVFRKELVLTSGCLISEEFPDCDERHVCTCATGVDCSEIGRCGAPSEVYGMFRAAPAVSDLCNVAVEEDAP